MKWIVNTAWNHPKGMDWQEMQEELYEGMKLADPGMTVHWFEIDKTNQGSVAIFPSKEVWENMRSRIEEHRQKEMDDKGVTMTYEVVGYVKAEGSS